MSRFVELLESELAEEKYRRQCAATVQREQEAAAVAVVRGSRIAERESVEKAAEQVAIEAVAAARAQIREQEAAWRAEEEDQAAKDSRRRADFFEQQSQIKDFHLGRMSDQHAEAQLLLRRLEARVVACESAEAQAMAAAAAALAAEKERTLRELRAAEGARRAASDDLVSGGAESEIAHCREEESRAEQLLRYLRSEVAGARDELNQSRALGWRVEEEVRADLRARVLAETRFADERKVQQEEHLDALQ